MNSVVLRHSMWQGTLRFLWMGSSVLLLCLIALNSEAQEYPLVKRGTFTFACSGDFRPFSYVDNEQALAGFDVDVGSLIAKELGLNGEAKKYKFAALIEGVNSGRFDAAVASHTITEARAQHVNFSTPYYYSGPQIFTRTGSELSQAEHLRDREIAVSKGSTYEKIARQYSGSIHVYDSDVTALEALSAGRHDAVITDFVTGNLAITRKLPLEGKAMLGRSAQAVAISRKNPELLVAVNSALDSLREKGTLRNLSMRYFGKDISALPEGETLAVAENTEGGTTAHPVLHFVHTFVESMPLFLMAAWLTVKLTTVSIVIGSLLGLFFAFLTLSRILPLTLFAHCYVYLVRGTPLIVQIFILYFGLTHIVKMPGFWAASLALGFHNGAYISEIFRGAIQSIDRGQFEAARSLGMPVPLMYRRVVLPQAVLRALPALGNQFIIGLKDSSLAAFISINELFNVATTQGANHFDQMTYLLIVAVYFLVLVLVLTFVVHVLEKRLTVDAHAGGML